MTTAPYNKRQETTQETSYINYRFSHKTLNCLHKRVVKVSGMSQNKVRFLRFDANSCDSNEDVDWPQLT